MITFTQDVLNIRIENIILFSLGLGSQPTLTLASQLRKNFNQIKGIILYSPYLNEELVGEIEISNIICPVFFINGQKNTLNDYKITKDYTKYFKKITEWYPKKGTFDTSNDPEPMYSYQDANDYCGIGSIAYTEDLSFVVQLGLDDKWHEV